MIPDRFTICQIIIWNICHTIIKNTYRSLTFIYVNFYLASFVDYGNAIASTFEYIS